MSAADGVTGGLLASELRLIVTRRRNIVGLTVLCVLPIVLGVVMRVYGPTGDGPPFLAGLTGNGLFLVLATLAVEMTVFLPMAVCILAGDTVAGEAGLGTLRYLLVVPVSRRRLLAVKFAALLIAAAIGVVAVATTAGVTGVALFGAGDLVTLSGGALGFWPALGRVALIAGYVTACLAAVAAIGLFASTLTEQPVGAAVGAFGWLVVDQVLGGIGAVDWLHPFLLSTYWSDWAGLLRDPVDVTGVLGGLISPAVYTVVFATAAWARFTTADVTS
ncbi:ABC-2 type transport system permease protein [Stackebrandtia albiflava]|uniref:ABC-2 type transport system permease protein n=1 Tax=Stackebrandtia albiflava TaxID=406432 RepID=A0A562UQM6_9ACTN|nr:ABC transporter permease subunit [Stackebrandtia albiflava]TWJ07920.1 ABC-2 type transport system permease protein [Stackebrandtia albiflava]